MTGNPRLNAFVVLSAALVPLAVHSVPAALAFARAGAREKDPPRIEYLGDPVPPFRGGQQGSLFPLTGHDCSGGPGSTTWFGGTHWDAIDSRWEANLGGEWTFDSGVAHKRVAGKDVLLEGWRPIDFTDHSNPFFRRLSSADPRWAGTVEEPTCVGAAGCMLLLIFDVTPAVGPAYTLLAFVIVITGGLGSMPGALVGGVLIGLTEAMAGLLFSPSAKSMFAFAILVVVLLFRPQGIMGKRAA